MRYEFGWLNINQSAHTLAYPGLGFSNQEPTTVVSPAFGQIVKIADESGGRQVIIDHGGGLMSVFRNLRVVVASSEDWLAKGKILGTLQSDPHKSLLPDWSVYLNNALIDPMLLVSRRIKLESGQSILAPVN
jgi:hypothetical protein